MVVIWGQRMYGRVDRFAGSHVATRFFHIYYLPLIPLASWLVLEEQGDGRFIGVQVPLQARSILSAWLRVASLILLAVMGVRALSFPADWARIHSLPAEVGSRLGLMPTFVVNVLFLGAVAAIAAYSWLGLGRLTRAEKAARVVYWDFAGKFVDVALLGEGRGAVKARAGEELDRHLIKHATGGYREAPRAKWREIATRPDQRDVALLRAALTRCRIEWSETRGGARRELARDHAQILERLLAASPDVAAVEQFEVG